MQPTLPAPVPAPVSDSFVCADCGAGPSPAWTGQPGDSFRSSNYAIRATDSAKVCRECAHRADLAAMRNAKPGERFCGAYCASGEALPGTRGEQPPRIGSAVSNWPGKPLGTVVSVGKVHRWTLRGPFGRRWYIRVRDVHGAEWYGTGAPGMYASLRRCK